ncbi:hypothetical protein TrVE_jg14021 [Triparma verrucosa]|uniref:EF-hand domain-containing protein n=1 Tax=Triparma verrucosa TaxID=1606542 RepID=A0A9W7BZV8_9STRA|nr:hypothetical protein TrVE_jg14021 [Triparma verrucosa]
MFRNRGSTLFHEDEELEHSNRRLAKFSFLFTLSYIALGVICFAFAEGWSFIHSLYFVVVTLTTVGYGDQGNWVSEYARFFCSVYALVGILLLGTALGVIGSEIITQHEKVVKEMQKKAAIRREKKLEKKLAKQKGVASPRASTSNLTETTRSSSFSSTYNRPVLQQLSLPFGILFAIIGCGMLLIYIDGGNPIDNNNCDDSSTNTTQTSDLSFNKCLYFAIITVTTIGYGDIHPNTEVGKFLAIFYILFGVTAVGNVLSEIANKVIDHQHRDAMERILTRKIAVHEFKDFDLDGNGTIERTEYVLRKMILVGLVDQADILRVEKEFDAMDLDGSGEITMEELVEFERRESEKIRDSNRGSFEGGGAGGVSANASVNPMQDDEDNAA